MDYTWVIVGLLLDYLWIILKQDAIRYRLGGEKTIQCSELVSLFHERIPCSNSGCIRGIE